MRETKKNMKTFYMVLTPCRWGKGETIAEALKNARYKIDEEFQLQIYKAEKSEDLKVDGFGGVHYTGESIFTSEQPEKLSSVVSIDEHFEKVMDAMEEKDFTLTRKVSDFYEKHIEFRDDD